MPRWPVPNIPLTFYEFFAGGGMARAGLGPGWHCSFANDFSPSKASSYSENWGADHFVLCDVARVKPAQLPGRAALAWASFPCQDLSLAGAYAGLGGSGDRMTRSGAFWHFWSVMKALLQEGRKPKTIVLENVCGALTSRAGADFVAICNAFAESGYRFGAVVIDAAHFVPQSRPRVFFMAVDALVPVPVGLMRGSPSSLWHPAALIRAQDTLTGHAKEGWLWWNLPNPPARNANLADLIEASPTDVRWHSPDETGRLLSMMSDVNRLKVRNAQRVGGRVVGAVYRRTRPDGNGVKCQRAEVRFDGMAGCLRTPGGGSSRQTIVVIENGCIRSRLLSSRELARLMGLPDSYRMPSRYNEAYHLAGDGVCVGVVRFLAEGVLEPLAGAHQDPHSIAAE
ncbi:MAG: DNA cytosine methyltransferase [Rhodobacter sp.]|nr:DNA cytosine methyltransferase [Rhodobacter sp.]